MMPSRIFFDDSFFKGEEKIKSDVYEKDGKKNYFTEITVNEFMMIDRTSNDDQADS